MGYEIVISRGYQWAEDDSFTPIELDEWNQVISSHSLVALDFVEMKNPQTGEVIKMKTPNSARVGDDGPVLRWRDGVVSTGADPNALELLRPIANTLEASFWGEEGEEY